jgi:3-hydroxyisobutyrate dehydrogenase-like beta-hydroxyacid dehydrogenase
MKRIGIVGVGMMGHGIATNIRKHGYPIVLLEHAGNQPLDALLTAGAIATSSAAELARNADIVILCVTGTPEVEDVLYREGGVISGLRPGAVVIDCSTSIPSSTLRVAESVTKAGAQFLDAPMTRTPKEAAEGRLNLIVGGDRTLFGEVKPLLECFAEHIVYAGPVGSGHKLKLLHNFVSLGYSAILAEAAACAQRGGVEPGVLIEILVKGGGAGIVLDRLRPYIESRDDSGFRFSIANALKDLRYYNVMAQELGAARAGAAAIEQVYDRGYSEGGLQATVPQLMSILAGEPLKSK